MAKGFDTATKLTADKARALKQAGFEYALRYLGNTWKGFNKAEAKAIQDAGLKLVSIFQKSANYAGYFSKEQGIRDAKQAQEWAEDVGQPEGTAIYFAVDFDAQGAHLKNVLAYVEGLKLEKRFSLRRRFKKHLEKIQNWLVWLLYRHASRERQSGLLLANLRLVQG